jgi:hypothetical protein
MAKQTLSLLYYAYFIYEGVDRMEFPPPLHALFVVKVHRTTPPSMKCYPLRPG